MFPLLIPMAIGAAGGALTSKKPLKGALLGAGLGAAGGAAAPMLGGLLGGGAAAPGAAAAAGAPGFGLGQPLITGAMGSSTAAAPTTGLLSSVNSTLSQYKPMMDAASTGLSMSGALNQEQAPQMQAPEVQQMQGGTQTLAQIAGQGADPQMQGDVQERMRRRQMMRGGV